jgi:ferredoxin-NADP reductase/CRP-like cAMP-binding protein
MSDPEVVNSLRCSPLFAETADVEINALAASCRIQSAPAGTIILKEGDEADDVYLLLGGELLVYTHDDTGRHLALARLSEVNAYVGEQGFLSAQRGRRSASVQAVTDSHLLRVPGSAFEVVLQQRSALRQSLREQGARQIRDKVSQQVALLRHLASQEGGVPLLEENFEDGAIVCQRGELGQKLYVILSGSARVFRTEPNGNIVQLAQLQSGQSFGELSLIEGKPRVASVAADGDLRVLVVAGDDFRKAYQADEHVRQHVTALRNLYSYGGQGVAVQFTAELFDRPAVAALYRLAYGRTVVAHRIIGQEIWSIQETDVTASVQVSFSDPTQNIERTLMISGDVVVGAIVKGPWVGVGRLHELVLEGVPLSATQINVFRESGEVLEAPSLEPEDPIICECMRVPRSALIGAINGGCHSVRELSARTGAGTVCGGCQPRLVELTGETLWQTANCVAVIDRGPRVKSFRFEIPQGHDEIVPKPGQRLVIRTLINGVPVGRPYTITSPVTERDHYEITVQREPQGFMSNWLFENMRAGVAIEVLPPSGTSFFDLADSRPLVSLVGGIGVTPALGICRSAAVGGSKRRIHVDYSVSTRADLVCEDELKTLTAKHGTVSLHTRITREQGRFKADDLKALAVELPKSDWLICGSKPFQFEAQKLLLAQGIGAQNIHVESFDAVGGAMPSATTEATVRSTMWRTVIGYLLLAAVAAFILQALLDLKFPLLERLQAKTVYSALTGAAIVALLVYQWQLGYVRLRGRIAEASRNYGVHIAIGPAIIFVIWLHSIKFGYALSMALSITMLASLATGAVLGARPRSPRWDGGRRVLLGVHILLTCLGSALAVTHGFMSLWY